MYRNVKHKILKCGANMHFSVSSYYIDKKDGYA